MCPLFDTLLNIFNQVNRQDTKSCAGISLAGIKPNTTSEQPLIQAGDSVIVDNEGACDFEFIITRTRVEPRDIVPGIYNYAGDFLIPTGSCKTGFLKIYVLHYLIIQ
jgi:hypothetical protein